MFHLIQRYYLLRCIFIFVFFVPAFLYADLLILNNGSRISGRFINENKEGVLFKTEAGIQRRYRHGQIKKLSIGYSGSPVCITEKNSITAKCNQQLYKLKDDHLLIAEGEGHLKLRKVPLSEIQKAELQTSKKSNGSLNTVIPQNTMVGLRMNNTTIKGKLKKTDDKTITIEDSDGKDQQYSLDELSAVLLDTDQSSSQGLGELSWYHMYPGIWQLEKGHYWRGSSMSAGFGLALLGVLMEYQAASAAAAGASADLSVLLFYNQSYQESFNQHQAMQQNLGGLALAIYSWYVLDVLFFGQPAEQSPGPEEGSTNLFMDLQLRPKTTPIIDSEYASFTKSRLNQSNDSRQNYQIQFGLTYFF